MAPQEAFIKAHGRIERILCGSTHEVPSEIADVAQKMIDIGIDVRYHKRDIPVVHFTYTWDYLYLPDSNEAVIWASAGDGGIHEAVFTQTGMFLDQNLADLYARIFGLSAPINKAGLVPGAQRSAAG